MVRCMASLLATSLATLLLASGVSGRGVLLPRTYCTNAKQVVAGNTCETIADKRCTVSLATFKSYNPSLDCSNLRVGQNFCCNEGTVPRDADCTNTKTVVDGNTCETIADKRCTVSLATFKSYNPSLDCSNLRVGQNFCCNEGTVPRDADCTNTKTVVDGNTCETIADKRCTVSLATFKSYNPQLDCANLKVGQVFCCNAGAVPLPTCTNIKTVVDGNTCTTIADKRCTISLSKFQDYNPVSFCLLRRLRCHGNFH